MNKAEIYDMDEAMETTREFAKSRIAVVLPDAPPQPAPVIEIQKSGTPAAAPAGPATEQESSEIKSYISPKDRAIITEFAKSTLGAERFDEFMKAGRGPGSRGGKVIGHTKSGKPIYASASKRPGMKGRGKVRSMTDFNEAYLSHLEAKSSKKKSKSSLTRGYKKRKSGSDKAAGRARGKKQAAR